MKTSHVSKIRLLSNLEFSICIFRVHLWHHEDGRLQLTEATLFLGVCLARIDLGCSFKFQQDPFGFNIWDWGISVRLRSCWGSSNGGASSCLPIQRRISHFSPFYFAKISHTWRIIWNLWTSLQHFKQRLAFRPCFVCVLIRISDGTLYFFHIACLKRIVPWLLLQNEIP